MSTQQQQPWHNSDVCRLCGRRWAGKYLDDDNSCPACVTRAEAEWEDDERAGQWRRERLEAASPEWWPRVWEMNDVYSGCMWSPFLIETAPPGRRCTWPACERPACYVLAPYFDDSEPRKSNVQHWVDPETGYHHFAATEADWSPVPEIRPEDWPAYCGEHTLAESEATVERSHSTEDDQAIREVEHMLGFGTER